MRDRSFTIRDARPDDRPRTDALTMEAYREYASVMEPDAWEELEGALRTALASEVPAERIVAVDDDGRIIGSAVLYPPASSAYGDAVQAVEGPEVRLVAVDPAARGRGIAQALMDECVRRARAIGASEIGIHTSASMRGAIRLYERMGFVRAPERDFRPPGSELVEGYRLPLG